MLRPAKYVTSISLPPKAQPASYNHFDSDSGMGGYRRVRYSSSSGGSLHKICSLCEFVGLKHPFELSGRLFVYMGFQPLLSQTLRSGQGLLELVLERVILAPQHPQTDGQSEIVNKAVGTYLRCLSSDKSRQWLDGCRGQSCGTTPLLMCRLNDPL